jgi:hypothetical protein
MMEIESVKEVLLGAMMMGDLVVGAFFLRYWKVTGDRFFVFFACSFALAALTRALLASYLVNSESEPRIYAIRLLSYVVIIAAIIDKNRGSIRKALFQRAGI